MTGESKEHVVERRADHPKSSISTPAVLIAAAIAGMDLEPAWTDASTARSVQMDLAIGIASEDLPRCCEVGPWCHGDLDAVTADLCFKFI